MDTLVNQKVNQWLESSIDDDSKAEIKSLVDQQKWDILTDAFYKNLEFGTGGLRGIMGVGTNRMNVYTVGMATQGLSNYLKKAFPGEEIKVAVAHDSRNNSALFARTTANVFSANGFTVYFFKALRPTPELSFAIRELGCQSGVVVTASHNPKEYNGFKAYWNDGAQLVEPHDENVIDEVNLIQNIDEVKFEGNSSKIIEIGEDLDQKYLSMIDALILEKDTIARQRDLKIVFTPIHGTGITLVPAILEKIGFNNIHIVKEQADPNGDFPTVVYPNPEEAEAMSLAMKMAENIDADIVMATDPDSDRVGIGVKNNHDKWQLLNGNQTGALIFYHLLNRMKIAGLLTDRHFMVNTIVTSDLLDRITEGFGVESYNTLTGFKHIAALIRDFEGKKSFIGGGEESYGYLIGDQVRDKDAIASCAVIAEIVASLKDQGKTVFDQLIDIYLEFGLYKEKLISITRKGQSGAEEIKALMSQYRSNPPQSLAGSKVVKLMDYQNSITTNIPDQSTETINLPKSNVLQFVTEDGTKVSARPSGTEPKIKFYISVRTDLDQREKFDSRMNFLDTKAEQVIKDLDL